MSAYMNNGYSQVATPVRAFPQNESEVNRIVNLSVFSNSSLLREGILSILAQYIEFCVVGCYSGDTIVSPLLPNPPNHVVLLDDQIGYSKAEMITCCSLICWKLIGDSLMNREARRSILLEYSERIA